MTILHVLALGQIGGMLRVVETLAVGQRRRGQDVHVAAVCEPGSGVHPMLVTLRRAGVGVAAVTIPTRSYLRERQRIAELCRALRPHVVHTHGYRPDVLDSGVARALGIPVVATVHGFTGGDWKNRFYEHLQRRWYRRFDAVVAVSRRMAGELAHDGVPERRIHAVPNGWSATSAPLDRGVAREALGIAPDSFELGWVGRVSGEKGPDIMIEALARLPEPRLSLSFLGDGPAREPLERRAAALGVADRIRWHGVVPDAARYFRAFDAFVLSSRTEGTPIALFEAMAAGVPIVAAAVGGVPEVVTPAEALLVAPQDPVALAAAIGAVLGDPAAAAARAGAAHRRLTTDFDAESWLDRYDTVYRHVQPETRELAAT